MITKTINNGVFTPEELLKARTTADIANNEGYNWDELANLFTSIISAEQVAKDLLYIFFEMTFYYVRDNDTCGCHEPLDRALCTIRQLYDAILYMTGDDKDKRLLCFTSKFDLKNE